MSVNIFSLIVLVFMIIKMIDGYNKGMVKEIISFISLVFLCLFAGLAAKGVASYQDGHVLNVVVVIFLLAVLGILHHVINLAVLPAKLVSKLPVIHGADKILGIAVGIFETILILWTIDTFLVLMSLGAVGEFFLQSTVENPVLNWFFQNNLLAQALQIAGSELQNALH